ncbi:MAG: response regulator [Deltaproteobacteria bacterium]|nr:response regulator [Deltaproteobacteria bacterium]
MRVLLVDDEGELVSALAERLFFRGIQADWTTDGKKAVEMAAAVAYDVIVLDMKMPGVSGLSVMQKIKETSPGPGFVFLTGHGSEEDRDAGRAAGASFYLMKPVKIDVLVEKMKMAAIEAGKNV